MKTCINKRNRFEIDLPEDWSGPGPLARLVGADRHPEFYGPNRASVKFAIGPISPEPSVTQQQGNLELIAYRHGHDVASVGSIVADGKEHATIVTRVPLLQPPSAAMGRPEHVIRPAPVMLLKSYSLIFNGVEYLATSSIDLFPEEVSDEIIGSFRRY